MTNDCDQCEESFPELIECNGCGGVYCGECINNHEMCEEDEE